MSLCKLYGNVIYKMDIIGLLVNSLSKITLGLSSTKQDAITKLLTNDCANISHIIAHVSNIAADGKITIADIPDIVMFAIELFDFLTSITFVSFTAEEILSMADNAVIVIITSPVFNLTEGELKTAAGVANVCLSIAKKTIISKGWCSTLWSRVVVRCCCYRPASKSLPTVTQRRSVIKSTPRRPEPLPVMC